MKLTKTAANKEILYVTDHDLKSDMYVKPVFN